MSAGSETSEADRASAVPDALTRRLRRWLLGRSGRALATWALVLSGCGALLFGLRSAGGQEPDVVEGDPAAGGVLYAQQCATCHGAAGGGGTIPRDGGEAPPIGGEHVDLAYWDLVLRVGRMPPPEGDPFDNRQRVVVYDNQQRADLNAFAVEALDVEGALPPAGVGDPGAGLETYAASCAACHGATGAGGVAGAGAWTPRIAGYDPQTIASAVRVGPFEMPRFGTNQLSDRDVADVTAFLTDVEEDPATLLGLAELNPVFLSGFVALLAIVLLISLGWISSSPTWFPDTKPAERRAPGESELS